MKTSAITALSVKVDTYLLEVEEMHITGKETVGFEPRSESDAILNVHIGQVVASKDAAVEVPYKVKFRLGNKIEDPLSEVNVNYRISVDKGGMLQMTSTARVQQQGQLEVCGTLHNTRDLILRDGGTLRMAFPANAYTDTTPSNPGIFEMDNLHILYLGQLEGSTKCDEPTTQITLQLDTFYRMTDFVLSPTYYTLGSGVQVVDVHEEKQQFPDDECDPDVNDLVIERTQRCYLTATSHSYGSITIRMGGQILLYGDEDGENKTTISVEQLTIEQGGKLAGVGTGYITDGPGGGNSNGEGGSYGGLGALDTVSDHLYGSPQMPVDYGSNGNSASSSGGKGGGQIKILVSGSFVNDGEVDMSGENSSSSSQGAGSGGSIYVQATNVRGIGLFAARGGGGGGRGWKDSGQYHWRHTTRGVFHWNNHC